MSRASDVPVVDCYWPLAFACGRQLCTCDADTVVSRVSGIILYTRILLLVLCYFSAHYMAQSTVVVQASSLAS